MGFKIRFLESALTDLEEIFAYSWAYFPDTTPDFGAPVDVFYRLREDENVVEVLQVRHSARSRR